jgi:aminodeoxyfutalosine synthase
MIKEVGRKPIERNTLYEVIQDYTDYTWPEDTEFRGYLDLPVLNDKVSS